jgi:hypothetical protein
MKQTCQTMVNETPMYRPVCICATAAMRYHALSAVNRKAHIPCSCCPAAGFCVGADAGSAGMAAAAGMDTSDAPAGLCRRRHLLPRAQRRCGGVGVAVQLLRVHVVRRLQRRSQRRQYPTPRLSWTALHLRGGKSDPAFLPCILQLVERFARWHSGGRAAQSIMGSPYQCNGCTVLMHCKSAGLSARLGERKLLVQLPLCA